MEKIFIDILLYIGWATLLAFMITLLFVTIYYGLMKVLNFKKVRFMFFKYSLNKSIKDFNDNEIASLINEIKKARY